MESYLGNTENWLFRLIRQLPDTKAVIASHRFLKCNYYPDTFEYLEFPIKHIEKFADKLPVRIFNRFASGTHKYYPWYIEKMAGGIDLMHTHFANTGWEYLPVAKRLKVPHVVSFYGLDYTHIPFVRPEWVERYQELFKKADMFLCEGSHGATLLKRMGCAPEKIRTARLGIDIDAIPFILRNKLPNELSLLQVATLTEKKGHIYTIQSFIEAVKECPNMSLTIVGRERDKGILNTLTQVLKGTVAEGKVTFIEQINFDKLYEFMRDYQVFINPSCHSKTMDCEGGAPIVLLDAQASGMPVISTTHCDIPEEVIHGETGLLSPEKDVTSLAQSIIEFYKMSTEKYHGIAAAGRQHVKLNYDLRCNAGAMRSIYQTVVGK